MLRLQLSLFLLSCGMTKITEKNPYIVNFFFFCSDIEIVTIH